jgi:hypothetical protein
MGRKRVDMKEAVIETIAKNSVFSPEEITRAFDIFKSYDLIIKACEFAQVTGYANLEWACASVKSMEQKSE